MKIIDPPKQSNQPFFMSMRGRKRFNNSDRWNETEKVETDEERRERKLKEYQAQFPRWKFTSTVTKNRITCSARNPLPPRPTPPGLEINEEEMFFKPEPFEINLPPPLHLPTIEDIEKIIEEEKEN